MKRRTRRERPRGSDIWQAACLFLRPAERERNVLLCYSFNKQQPFPSPRRTNVFLPPQLRSLSERPVSRCAQQSTQEFPGSRDSGPRCRLSQREPNKARPMMGKCVNAIPGERRSAPVNCFRLSMRRFRLSETRATLFVRCPRGLFSDLALIFLLFSLALIELALLH